MGGDNTLLIIVILAIVVLVWMFLRTKRAAKTQTITRRHWEEFKRMQEEEGPPPEPQWHLRDVDAGGKIHLSLPKGLEEDFDVVRRDRLMRPDEQIEYSLLLVGVDPEHPMWLNWWTVGVYTHAWLVERSEYTLDTLGLTVEALEQMRQSGTGSISFRDQVYMLDHAGVIVLYEGGLRPGKEFYRWDFRNERGTRQILIQLREWESEEYQVLMGRELWLRDLKVITPRRESPHGNR